MLKNPRPPELTHSPRGVRLGRTFQLPPAHAARPRPLFPPMPVRAGSVVRVVGGADGDSVTNVRFSEGPGTKIAAIKLRGKCDKTMSYA